MKERLEKFIEYKEISNRRFLKNCGLSETYISTMTGNPSGDTIAKIQNRYPELNIQWLKTGEGEMLNIPSAEMSAHTPKDSAAIMSQHQVIASATTDHLTVVPAEIIEEIKAEVVAESSIPVISPDVANKPNFDVRIYLKENMGELEHINPAELLKDADAAERVLRGAMQPTFIPSDVVFIRFLRNKTKIIDGNIYYFDLKSRPTMIRKVKIEGNKLRLIAENPEFGDVITDFEDILNVAEIVGMFRTTFSTQYSEIEAIRRKKDEQIDNLINEISRAGSRSDQLIGQNTVLMQKLIDKLR
ncbi:MAG: hypothetical protein IKM12_00365 [Alistipes sp.]|nr:hypothetical protein [Alistipes sp.]